MYGYIKSEPRLWTVGFYDPHGNWHPESDWSSADEAAKRVHYLNGGNADLLATDRAYDDTQLGATDGE